MAVNVSLFFRVPVQDIGSWPAKKVKENFVSILYYNKKMKENDNGGN
jgi:hypothetical protein